MNSFLPCYQNFTMKLPFILLLCCCTTHALGQKFLLSAEESSLRWTGKAAFTTYALSGDIEPATGVLIIKEEKIIRGSVIIDMNTIRSDEFQKLTRHLKSTDFFDVKGFPEARFALTPPLPTSANSASGIFEIRGNQREERVPLEIDRSGDRLEITGVLTLDRTEYGIYYNSPNYFKNIKQQAIADEFMLKFQFVFRAEQPGK